MPTSKRRNCWRHARSHKGQGLNKVKYNNNKYVQEKMYRCYEWLALDHVTYFPLKWTNISSNDFPHAFHFSFALNVVPLWQIFPMASSVEAKSAVDNGPVCPPHSILTTSYQKYNSTDWSKCSIQLYLSKCCSKICWKANAIILKANAAHLKPKLLKNSWLSIDQTHHHLLMYNEVCQGNPAPLCDIAEHNVK